jgi:predicted amidohydrolase
MESSKVRLALAQMTSTTSIRQNEKDARRILAEAKAGDADLVTFPECANLIQRDPLKASCEVCSEDEDLFIKACREFAAATGIWVHTGSSALQDPAKERFSNRSLLIAGDGRTVARYDKIHLFDVDLDDGEIHRESDRYEPGDRAAIAETPWGVVGLTICYDMRFPHLFRDLVKAGAGIIFVPSAFTVPTGKAHWETLLRCRAIENGVFVVAAAQCGQHADGRITYGHSLVVDPWGEVLLDAGPDPAIQHVTLDLERVTTARSKIPSLINERPYIQPS